MADAAVGGVSSAMGAIFILLAVGALIGAWNMAGTIPTVVDIGIALVSPTWLHHVPHRVLRRGLAPQVLSRAVEDSRTVTSVLVPWNTCGAYTSGVLGISTASYFPYCGFNLASPLLDLAFGFLGFKAPTADRPWADEPEPEPAPTPVPVPAQAAQGPAGTSGPIPVAGEPHPYRTVSAGGQHD